MRLPDRADLVPCYRRLRFRLDCGREVDVEGLHITPSTIGYLEGSREYIRDPIIQRLPERVRQQFPGISGLFIKPVPEGELPVHTFMVDLVCHEPVSDRTECMSMLTVCWLGDDIEASLPELIDSEIRSVEWDKYAVDGSP